MIGSNFRTQVIRTTNGTLPALGLDIDNIQAEPILLDDSIDSFIPASAYYSPRILAGTSVAKRD